MQGKQVSFYDLHVQLLAHEILINISKNRSPADIVQKSNITGGPCQQVSSGGNYSHVNSMAMVFPVINTRVDIKDHDRILTGTTGSIGKGVLVKSVIGTITQQQLAERGMNRGKPDRATIQLLYFQIHQLLTILIFKVSKMTTCQSVLQLYGCYKSYYCIFCL
jgi:hypothetical protein